MAQPSQDHTSLPLVKYSHDNWGPAEQRNTNYRHYSQDLVVVVDTFRGNGSLMMKVIQGTQVLESLDLEAELEKNARVEELCRRHGTELSKVQLPISAILRSPLFAIRFTLPDGRTRKAQFKFTSDADFNIMLRIMTRLGLPMSSWTSIQNQSAVTKPAHSSSINGATAAPVLGRPQTAGSSYPATPTPDESWYQRSGTRKLDQPRIQANATRNSTTALVNDRSTYLGEGLSIGRLQSSPSSRQRAFESLSLQQQEVSFAGSTSASSTVSDTVNHFQPSPGHILNPPEVFAKPVSSSGRVPTRDYRPFAAMDFTPDIQTIPGVNNGAVRPGTALTDVSASSLPPRRELPFARPSVARPSTAEDAAKPKPQRPNRRSPGKSTPATAPLRSDAGLLSFSTDGGKSMQRETPSSDMIGSSPRRPSTSMRPPSRPVSGMNLSVSGCNKTLSSTMAHSKETTSDSDLNDSAVGQRPSMAIRAPPPNLSARSACSSPAARSTSVTFGLPPLPQPTLLTSVSQGAKTDSLLSPAGEVNTSLLDAQPPIATLPPSSRHPVDTENVQQSRVLAHLADVLGMDESLASYALQSDESRMAALDDFMVQQIGNDDFLLLCEDMNYCWRRIALHADSFSSVR